MKNKKKEYLFAHKLQRFLSENMDDQIVIDFCKEYNIELPKKVAKVDNFELLLRYISQQDLAVFRANEHILKQEGDII